MLTLRIVIPVGKKKTQRRMIYNSPIISEIIFTNWTKKIILKGNVDQDALPPKSFILEFHPSVKKYSVSKMAFLAVCKHKIVRDIKLWVSLLRKMGTQEKTEEFRAAYHGSVWRAKPAVSVSGEYDLNICNYVLKIMHYIQILAEYLGIL